MLCVNDASVDLVLKLFQGFPNHLERVSFIVAQQVLHVLQEECLGLLCGDDSRYVQEERALRRAFKSVWMPERILF